MVLLYIMLILAISNFVNGAPNIAVGVLIPKRHYELPTVNELLKAWASEFDQILFIIQKGVRKNNSSFNVINKRFVDLEYDWDYFEAFSRVLQRFPTSDWYIIAEYNTYLNMNWIRRATSKLDPKSVHILGSTLPHTHNFIRVFAEEKVESYVWGGTGITASSLAVMDVILSNKCKRFDDKAFRDLNSSNFHLSRLIKTDEVISFCIRKHLEQLEDKSAKVKSTHDINIKFPSIFGSHYDNTITSSIVGFEPQIYSIFGDVTFHPALLTASKIGLEQLGSGRSRSWRIQWQWSRYCRDFTNTKFNMGLTEEQVLKRQKNSNIPEKNICIDAKNVGNMNYFDFFTDHPSAANSNMSIMYTNQLQAPTLQTSTLHTCYHIPGMRLATNLMEMNVLEVKLWKRARSMFQTACRYSKGYVSKQLQKIELQNSQEFFTVPGTKISNSTESSTGCLDLLIFGVTKGGSSSLSLALKRRWGFVGPNDGMYYMNTETMHCVPFLSPCSPVLPTPSTSVFGDFNRSYSVYRSLVEQCFSCGFQKGYLQMFPFQHKTCQRLSDKWDLSVEDAKGKLRRFDGVSPTQARLIEKQPDALMFPHLAEYYFRLYLENKFNYNSSMRMESISNFKLQHDDLGLKRIDGMQLMLVLRDPVTRLFSHFNHYQKALRLFSDTDSVLNGKEISSLLSMMSFDEYVDFFIPYAKEWRDKFIKIHSSELEMMNLWTELIYSICEDIVPEKIFGFNTVDRRRTRSFNIVNKKKFLDNQDLHMQCSLKRGLVQGFYYPQLLHWINRFSLKGENLNDKMMVVLFESLYGNDTKREVEFKRIERFLRKKTINFDTMPKMLRSKKSDKINGTTIVKLYNLYDPMNRLLFQFLNTRKILKETYLNFWNN